MEHSGVNCLQCGIPNKAVQIPSAPHLKQLPAFGPGKTEDSNAWAPVSHMRDPNEVFGSVMPLWPFGV